MSRASGPVSARPGGNGARSRSARGALTLLPEPPEAALTTAERAVAARRVRWRCAVRERPRRLASTGRSSRGCGANTADPRAASTARMTGGRASKTGTAFEDRDGATAARGEWRGNRAWPGLASCKTQLRGGPVQARPGGAPLCQCCSSTANFVSFKSH